jgi:hypothetical protein
MAWTAGIVSVALFQLRMMIVQDLLIWFTMYLSIEALPGQGKANHPTQWLEIPV